jgi:hypothetical protein
MSDGGEREWDAAVAPAGPAPPPERFLLSRCGHWVWDCIRSVDLSYGGSFIVSLREFERCVVYALVLYFSATNGLAIPTRFDSTFQNLTQSLGMFPDSSDYRIRFTGTSFFPRRFSVYGQFFRRSLLQFVDTFYPATSAGFHVSVTEVKGRGRAKIFRENISVPTLRLRGTDRSQQIPLFRRYDTTFAVANMNVTVTGNLGCFDVFQVIHISENVRYKATDVWNRIVFILFAIGCLWDKSKTKERAFVSFVILLVYGPTTVLGLLGTNQFTFVLDLVLRDLFSVFIFAFWVAKVANVAFFFQVLTETAVGVMAIFVIRDSVLRGAAEYDDFSSWLFEGFTERDRIMMYIFAGMLGSVYLLFLVRKRDPNDATLDLGTYSCFVTGLSHCMDELLIRLKFLKCFCLGTSLRIWSEIACVFFMTCQPEHRVKQENTLLS